MDIVLTEALVAESRSRAANLRSTTIRNVLFGGAAVLAAGLAGTAALIWADHQRTDAAAIAAMIDKIPTLKVEPVQIAEGQNIGIRADQFVGIEPGATIAVAGDVGIKPGSFVEVRGGFLPAIGGTDIVKDGDGNVIRREVTVFSFSGLPNNRSVVTGWNFPNGGAREPTSEFCYLSLDGRSRSERIDLANDRRPVEANRTLVADFDGVLNRCVWWSS